MLIAQKKSVRLGGGQSEVPGRGIQRATSIGRHETDDKSETPARHDCGHSNWVCRTLVRPPWISFKSRFRAIRSLCSY